ncbi:MAG: lamin tail domain-containing protein [Tannerellaceae bacterium]|nr:lamin tail domain-containing protein [Tannerellaceae bacterium]
MIRKKTGVFLLLICLLSAGVEAQRVTSMRINEVLVINEDNFVDDYGKRGSWVELYNTSAGSVDIRGCFLTNDRNNPKKYPIPKGDVLTKIRPRQHVIFWIDEQPSRGTFHVNFKFDPDRENYIALYDADGKTLVDEVTIPCANGKEVSYGRTVDGHAEWGFLEKVTPSTNNLTLDTNDKIDNFRVNDSLGVGMTLTAMAVVFCGLILLYLIFKFVGKLSVTLSIRRAQKTDGSTVGQDVASGEILAAIGTALFELDEDVHDIENTVLTIQKVKRNYSPWNSKIYGLREIPGK